MCSRKTCRTILLPDWDDRDCHRRRQHRLHARRCPPPTLARCSERTFLISQRVQRRLETYALMTLSFSVLCNCLMCTSNHYPLKCSVLMLYYSARNKFERFRFFFLVLISRFEFEFCRCVNFFLKDSNFWCVHVNVPWPVCTHAIPFRMLWLPRFMMTEIYTSMKPLWKVVQIVR